MVAGVATINIPLSVVASTAVRPSSIELAASSAGVAGFPFALGVPAVTAITAYAAPATPLSVEVTSLDLAGAAVATDVRNIYWKIRV